MINATEPALLEQLSEQLHDLCQPLSALQCRLEIALMDGSDSSLLEATRGSLEETHRLFAAIARMRQIVSPEPTPRAPVVTHHGQEREGNKA